MSEAENIELLQLLREAVPLMRDIKALQLAPPASRVVKRNITEKPTKQDIAEYLNQFLPGISDYIKY